MSSELVKLTNSQFSKTLMHHHNPSRNVTKFIFSNPINFSVKQKENWAIIGTNSYKTEFLKVLSGSDFAYPGLHSRSYPSSSSVDLLRFVNNGNWGHGAHDSSGGFTHLSSRYEFFKDLEIDEKVNRFIADVNYNSNHKYDEEKVMSLVKSLHLTGLEDKFITTLSNGQFRRARIAKALYRDAGLLLIDDPFLGLDPIATGIVSDVLKNVANSQNLPTTIGIGLRIQDDVPEWIRKVAIIDESGVSYQGEKTDLEYKLKELKDIHDEQQYSLEKQINERIHLHYQPNNDTNFSNTLVIDMKGVDIKYKGIPVLQNLHWKVKDGEKWHVRGRNGSGKTTLLSLITLDHPQSWNKKIFINGIQRATGKTNFFDNNKIIGFTSPELHAIFPKKLSVFQTISTGYIVGSYIPPRLDQLSTAQIERVQKYLHIVDLEHLKDLKFGDISVSNQKLILLLRALINDPKILILDESLSGMTDEDVLKGKALINQWDKGCVLVIGHVDHEVPKCDKYILMNDSKDGVYDIGDIN